MTRILFYLEDFPHEPWRSALSQLEPNIEFCSYPDWGSPEDGEAFAVVWEPKTGLLRDYPNLKAVFSLGAGIDHIIQDQTVPEGLPIIRMGDDGLVEGMQEYILMQVLMHHRQMPLFIAQQQTKTWKRSFSRPAAAMRVGIMGYGALGKAAAQMLQPIGYDLAAWSNSAKPSEGGIDHFTGSDNLQAFLARTDILVCLLPETEQTIRLLNSETLGWLPEGAAIINAGRGSLIDLSALETCLSNNHVSAVTLDVTPEEPLPQDHWLWQHERVIITPHVAAITRTDTAANYIINNIKSMQAGNDPQNMLNRKRGY